MVVDMCSVLPSAIILYIYIFPEVSTVGKHHLGIGWTEALNFCQHPVYKLTALSLYLAI